MYNALKLLPKMMQLEQAKTRAKAANKLVYRLWVVNTSVVGKGGEIHTTYVFIHRVRERGMEGEKDNDRKKERL